MSASASSLPASSLELYESTACATSPALQSASPSRVSVWFARSSFSEVSPSDDDSSSCGGTDCVRLCGAEVSSNRAFLVSAESCLPRYSAAVPATAHSAARSTSTVSAACFLTASSLATRSASSCDFAASASNSAAAVAADICSKYDPSANFSMAFASAAACASSSAISNNRRSRSCAK